MINLSSFIAFHARRTPERCALKYRGENISYASFDARIRTVAGWLASRGIGACETNGALQHPCPGLNFKVGSGAITRQHGKGQ